MERARRTINRPKWLQDEDVVWEHPVLMREPEKKRFVFRPLKRKDIKPSLLGREVFMFWPDDQQWYRATVESVKPQTMHLTVIYTDDDVFEELDAADLVRDGHIAVKEERDHGAALKRGDVPLDTEDQATAFYLDEDSGDDDEPLADGDKAYEGSEEADGNDSAEAEFEDTDSDEERRLRAKKLRAAAERAAERNHKQTQQQAGAPQQQQQRKRLLKSVSTGAPTGSAAPSSAAKKQRLGTGAAVLAAARTAPDANGSSELQQAEAFKTAVLGALIESIGLPTQRSLGPYGGSTSLPSSKASATPKMSAAAASELEMRRKAREQLTSFMKMAADEIRKEGQVPEASIGDPATVGLAIEMALYKHYNGLTKEYKNRYRSMSFNLRDPANPDLRRRVLQGELLPEVLVGLDSANLASKQLAEARERKEKEFDKAKFLDAETAAKYSTAAAAALKDQRLQALQVAGGKLLATQDNVDASGSKAREREEEEEREELKRAASLAAAQQQQEQGEGEGGAQAESGDGQAHPQGSGALFENGGSFLLDRGASGLMGDTAMVSPTSVIGQHSSAELRPRVSTDGMPEGGAAMDTAARAKVVSLKPVVPVATAGSSRDNAEYDPDDFIVGDDGNDAAAAAKAGTSPQHDREHSGAGAEVTTISTQPSASAPQTQRSVQLPPALVSPAHRSGSVRLHDSHHDKHHQHHHSKEAASELIDLGAVVSRPEPGAPAASIAPGTTVWQGRLGTADFGVVSVACAQLAGPQEIARMMPPINVLRLFEVDVKGTTRLSKVEEFMEELKARSRSRTATLGLMRASPPPDQAAPGVLPPDDALAPPEAQEVVNKLIKQLFKQERSGVIHPAPQLEAYLLPPCRLARRLLLTARLASPPQWVHLFPPDVPAGQLLVAIIHRREWKPPVVAPAMPLPALRPAAEPPAGGGAGAEDGQPPAWAQGLAQLSGQPLAFTAAPAPAAAAAHTVEALGDPAGPTATATESPPAMPNPQALQDLLASLAPALQGGPLPPGASSPGSEPPPAQHTEAPPAGLPLLAGLDHSMLSTLASALQGAAAAAGGSGDPLALLQQLLPQAATGAPQAVAQQPPVVLVPGAAGVGGAAPLVMMKPDGTFALVQPGPEGPRAVLAPGAGAGLPPPQPPAGWDPHAGRGPPPSYPGAPASHSYPPPPGPAHYDTHSPGRHGPPSHSWGAPPPGDTYHGRHAPLPPPPHHHHGPPPPSHHGYSRGPPRDGWDDGRYPPPGGYRDRGGYRR